jgi:hypothetical protein
MKVVVAGRVCSLDTFAVAGWVLDVVAVPVVVVWVLAVPVDDWAEALDATASVNAAAITKRFLNIRTASKLPLPAPGALTYGNAIPTPESHYLTFQPESRSFPGGGPAHRG